MGMEPIEEPDVRAVVRILGDVAISEIPATDKRLMVMEGLVSLIDADAWIWSVAAHTESGKHPAYSIFLKDGFSDAEFGKMLCALEHPDMGRLTAPFFHEFSNAQSHITRLRQQIDPTDAFLESDALPLWKEADYGPLILSARPTSDGEVSMIGIYRRFERRQFTERESRIAHIVLSEVGWLHESALPNHPNESVATLSPRLRQVLNLLLQGNTRKEIAADLEISLNTINEYIKEVYRRFGVGTHPDLMRKFFLGDGGDIPSKR